MQEFYNRVCEECSMHITKRYSTSFSLGIRVFEKKVRAPIYSIYGFVRFADEIVDTFHDYDKGDLLDKYETETFKAIDQRISLNPILQSFQNVFHQYNLERTHVHAFFESMRMDLNFSEYGDDKYNRYIYGSAEVIGLMCLKVFLNDDGKKYDEFKHYARSLGAAFQKVNFLRDMKSDFDDRGRVYFPGVDFINFNASQKLEIEKDIQNDFDEAYKGIVKLPKGSRFGVYLAYIYYTKLFRKIKKASPSLVKQQRLRIHDSRKLFLLFKSFLRHRLNWL
jgi:phytoene/squalene synthetase